MLLTVDNGFFSQRRRGAKFWICYFWSDPDNGFLGNWFLIRVFLSLRSGFSWCPDHDFLVVGSGCRFSRELDPDPGFLVYRIQVRLFLRFWFGSCFSWGSDPDPVFLRFGSGSDFSGAFAFLGFSELSLHRTHSITIVYSTPFGCL